MDILKINFSAAKKKKRRKNFSNENEKEIERERERERERKKVKILIETRLNVERAASQQAAFSSTDFDGKF